MLRSEEGGALQFNDTWVLTLSKDGGTASWRRLETHGEPPSPRTGCVWREVFDTGQPLKPYLLRRHALACVDGQQVLLIGGCSASTGFLADAYSLDVGSWTWTAIAHSTLAPSPRDKLSATVLGDRVMIFGGFGPQEPGAAEAHSDSSSGDKGGGGEESEEGSDSGDAAAFTWFNDVHTLKRTGGAWAWSATEVLGEPPSARAAHAAAAVGSRMFVFGGRDTSGRINDTFALDAVPLSWSRIAADAPAPAARSFHVLASLQPSPGAVCFGGLSTDGTMLDSLEVLDARAVPVWAQPEERTGTWPPPCAIAASAMLGSRLVVISAASSDGQPCSCTMLDCAAVRACLDAPVVAAAV